jgi:hypothetical protein
MSAGHAGKYEVTVAADSADEAIEIAAEALPKGSELIKSEAARESEGVWRVKLAFRGGKRASSDLIE